MKCTIKYVKERGTFVGIGREIYFQDLTDTLLPERLLAPTTPKMNANFFSKVKTTMFSTIYVFENNYVISMFDFVSPCAEKIGSRVSSNCMCDP